MLGKERLPLITRPDCYKDSFSQVSKDFAIDHRIDGGNPKSFKCTSSTIMPIFLLFYSVCLFSFLCKWLLRRTD